MQIRLFHLTWANKVNFNLWKGLEGLLMENWNSLGNSDSNKFRFFYKVNMDRSQAQQHQEQTQEDDGKIEYK